MNPDWHFPLVSPGTTVREPVANAFFDSDAVSSPGEALVREAVQNSLDAALPDQPPWVCISLIELEYGDVEPYYANAVAHIETPVSGIRPEHIPSTTDKCIVLVYEDFNTTGLEGDPNQPYPPRTDEENNFYHFFRAEGRSDKESGKRGSWGLGKDTFFRATRTSTVFGLTTRASDGLTLLMGKVLLNSHYMNNQGNKYYQDGYWGVANSDGNLILPTQDTGHIARFKETFQVTRNSKSGLSIIAPWLHQEISIVPLLKSIIKNYTYAILSGSLTLSLATPAINIHLTRDTLRSEVAKVPELKELLPEVDFTSWVLSHDATATLTTLLSPASNRGWQWNPELFPGELLKELSVKIRDGAPIALRVPVTVRKRRTQSRRSYFDVYLYSDEHSESTKTLFIRDQIVISDVRTQPIPGIRSLVVSDDEGISQFLRLAENPSHTEWRGNQVKQDYTSGVGDLSFVIQSVRNIYKLATSQDKEEDKLVLADIFPLPGHGSIGPVIPTLPQKYNIRDTDDGFVVRPGEEPLKQGDHARVWIAYDTRRGNALKQYQPTDFNLLDGSLNVQCHGVEVIEKTNNSLIVQFVDPRDFSIAVDGFDQNRQIFVVVRDWQGE